MLLPGFVCAALLPPYCALCGGAGGGAAAAALLLLWLPGWVSEGVRSGGGSMPALCAVCVALLVRARASPVTRVPACCTDLGSGVAPLLLRAVGAVLLPGPPDCQRGGLLLQGSAALA